MAYDGTDFWGFQAQPVGPTVQGVLEAALERVNRAPARIVAAGRTDTGVHASGQVIHFDYRGPVPIDRLALVLNTALPRTVAVLQCRRAAPSFHARYSALSRTYRYSFLNSDLPAPLRERFAWRLGGRLDVAAMAAGADLFLGEHSFRRFGSIPGDTDQQERSRRRHGWRRRVLSSRLDYGGDELWLTVEANAFLTHMARSLAATLAALGRGSMELEAVADALDDSERDAALVTPAPPRGLCLVRVRYPDDGSREDHDRERME